MAFTSTETTDESELNTGWTGHWMNFDWVAEETATDTPETTQTTETTTAPYSDEAIADLLYMIEEEKLAGDVYEAFYKAYGLTIFDNIAQSEDSHFSALIQQAETLGIDTDQFVFEPAGTFVNEELQQLYDTLIATGNESVTAALEVGVAIEEKDIVDIAATIEDVAGTQLADVYQNLLDGSANHLEAFQDVLMA
ncbi:DUF2202 domain-containing protein [Acidimangrovimonas pyrenivorans]|uniref:DUF2202 domain-containing protein n=1 Tax=Acidimangrovimonas pyrenivorans TaxID=2030798 RepID=A0ABV7AE64_9RHOB